MKVVIVIPTYNESQSIEDTVSGIEKYTSKITKHKFYVLVVDGNSPDGTATVVKSLGKKYDNVELLLEKKKGGLGRAYVAGFKYAMTKMSAEVVFEMDADGQHDPSYLPKFMEKIDEGYDYVIGARYIKGGSIPKEWGIHRKFLSVFGNLFTRLVLGLPILTDYTTGFRATRVKNLLEKVDLDHLISYQFPYKTEILLQLVQLKAKVIEIPLIFKTREKQQSKATIATFFDSLRVVILLRYRMSKRFVKVCIVGAIGATIQFGLFFILKNSFGNFKGIGVISEKAIFNAVATEIAILVNFMINNFWGFKDRRISFGAKYFSSLVKFNFMVLGSLLIQSLVLQIGHKSLGLNTDIWDVILISIGILIGLIYNYVVYKKIIWRVKK